MSRREKPIESVLFSCGTCGKSFRLGSNQKRALALGNKVYCSKECSENADNRIRPVRGSEYRKYQAGYARRYRKTVNDNPDLKRQSRDKINAHNRDKRAKERGDRPRWGRVNPPDKSRICKQCSEEKPYGEPYLFFPKGSHLCKQCSLKNLSQWGKDHPDKRAESRRRRERELQSTSIPYKILRKLRNRLRETLKGKTKSASTMALLGCSLENFRNHIESQFKRGMTWGNFGTAWHLDHVFPCNRFDLTKPEEQRRCFHWTNLQPLSAKQNIKKWTSVTEPQMPLLF